MNTRLPQQVVLLQESAGRERTRREEPLPTITPKRLRPECGARTRAGGRCKAKAVWDDENDRPRNGRCRMHGGNNTGPKTPEGKAKCIALLNRYRKRR